MSDVERAEQVLDEILSMDQRFQQAGGRSQWRKSRRRAKRYLTGEVARELGCSAWWGPLVWWVLSSAVRELIKRYLEDLFPDN